MIQFENVGVRYGNGPEVLSDVTFRLKKGAMAFLTGPSGAGKTTLLKLLYLGLRPTRGLIRLFDQDIATLPRGMLPEIRKRIGVVFQDYRLLDHLTAYENVALPLFAAGRKPARYRNDVLDILDWVGLSKHVNARPEVMSGGERQRTAIARAVIGRPDLLLADEPTGNVDPQLARRLLRLFVELNRLGTTVVIATHDASLIAATPGAQVMAISNGKVSLAPGLAA